MGPLHQAPYYSGSVPAESLARLKALFLELEQLIEQLPLTTAPGAHIYEIFGRLQVSPRKRPAPGSTG